LCTPILLAGAALAVGSAVANTIATNQQTQARNDVLAAERIRQSGFDQQTQAINNQSRDRYVDFVPQQEAKAAALGDILAQRVNDPNSAAATVMPSSSSSVVNQEIGKQTDKAQQYVDQQGGALANMRSFGDLLGEISSKQARDASQVAQIGGFKQASENLQPLELDNASHAGDMAKFIADIMQGGATVAGASAGLPGGSFWTNNLFAPTVAKVGTAVAGGASRLNPALLAGGALGVT
jgi:hypothetical protein